MSNREKKLAMMVGFCVLAVGLMAAYYKLVNEPVLRLEAQIRQGRSTLSDLNDEQRDAFTAQEAMGRRAAQSFGEHPDEAAAAAGAMLTRNITEVGLSDSRFSRRPTGTRRIRGGVEIGWQIQGQGPLDQIIDLLYVLENAPYLQRLENIVISPDSRNDEEVTVNFRYLTLVLEAVPVEPAEPLPAVAAEDEGRRVYDPIAARNMLRPYVAKPPEPEPEPEPEPVQQAEAPAPEPEPGPAPPGPETFRVVSLSEWRGETEILIHDRTADKMLSYSPGDELAAGTVVMVDYRPLALPDDPSIRSQSRVIVRQDSEYWAIERGATLADKRKLTQEELPADLRDEAPEISQQADSP
ncbi:MAG: hypothetical protein WD294_14355 [Phycisphaeraceae bacterium]